MFSGLKKPIAFLALLARSSKGNIMPMTAAAIFLLAGLVGGGIDISRSYMVQNRLQNACDAGTLAGRRAVDTNGFDDTAKGQANQFFKSNFDDTEEGVTTSSFNPTSSDNGNTITGTATATLPTVVMSLFGYKQTNLSVTCSASMSVGNSDVMMVLDTTGSMSSSLGSGTRISALQDAMKNFYTTVKNATAGSNARVRYGFVPFSSTVNVGHLLYDADPDYLVDSWPIQSRKAVTKSVQNQDFDHWGPPVHTTSTGTGSTTYDDPVNYGSTYSKKSSCTNSLPADVNWANYGSSSTDTSSTINSRGQKVTTTTVSQQQRGKVYDCGQYTTGSGRNKTTYYQAYYQYEYRTQFSYGIDTQDPVYVTVTTQAFDHWSYEQVTYDTSTYKTFTATSTPTGNNGAAQTSTWKGCIEERHTVSDDSFSYSSLTGLSPEDAYDIDIDKEPESDQTKWAPLWPEVSYYRTAWVSSGWYGGYYAISNVNSSLTGAKTSAYCPQQAQLLTSMTEDAFDDYADSLYPEGSTYLDIGLTWGGRLASPTGIFADNVTDEPANGGKVARHIIFMTDGFMEPSNTIQSAYGVEFHDRRVTDDGSTNDAARHSARFRAVCDEIKAKGIRIWVIAFTSALSTDLQDCASTNSSFTAKSADQLNSAFQQIAKNVGELRIVT
jgi:Flp pilus assembly protein TadG